MTKERVLCFKMRKNENIFTALDEDFFSDSVW